jgi:nucleoside-diphosphate-sugar epimerase
VKVLVIGGTGHTGGYLVRDLVAAGHEVVTVSRGRTSPYLEGPFWNAVRRVTLDRREGEQDGRLGELLVEVEPEAVVDITCYEPESAEQLVALLAGKIGHVVHVGTAWVHGEADEIPTPETWRGRPLNDYARKKLAIQDFYLQAFEQAGFPVTIVNPTQITGPGKMFVTPEGDKDVGYLDRMRAGEEVPLPAFGRPLVQHVHPRDVAQVMRRALEQRNAATGQVYNASSARAMTYHGLFRLLRDRFGSDCTSRPMSLKDYQDEFGPNETVRQHMIQPCCVDIRKAADQLGYEPAYTAAEAVLEALEDLVTRDELG